VINDIDEFKGFEDAYACLFVISLVFQVSIMPFIAQEEPYQVQKSVESAAELIPLVSCVAYGLGNKMQPH
jgi:hypothetical protein